MFITTLLTAPANRSLSFDMVESLRGAWGGGDAVWLAPDEAAEFSMSTMPDNHWDVWADLQKLGVDLVVQPAEGRRKKLLLADMDSTMIRQECIDELADAVGVGDRVKGITARAMNGELDFEQALRARVALLAGQPDKVIDEVLETRITMAPGAQALVATMRANGAYTALISGGFTAFAMPVAARLGFHEARANGLLTKNNKITGKVAVPILGRAAKVERLHDLVAEHGGAVQDVLAVGDGANDLGMLGVAGMGVALHAKPVVAAECDIRINFGNLTSLLYLQGYKRSEFVSR